jgi:hypothetical protein
MAPTWTDDRYKTVAGRKAILSEASVLVFKKLSRCGSSGSETPLINMIPKCLDERGMPFAECDIDIVGWNPGVPWTKAFFEQISLLARYEPIQKRADTGARISPTFVETDEGWWAQWPGSLTDDPHRVSESEAAKFEREYGPLSVDHRIRMDAAAEIEVFPAVFEQGQLWIKSEKRWARTPVEAIAYVLLHELAHLDSEMAVRVHGVYGRWVFKEMDGSEDGAWQYAQSVMRCTRQEFRVLPFSH